MATAQETLVNPDKRSLLSPVTARRGRWPRASCGRHLFPILRTLGWMYVVGLGLGSLLRQLFVPYVSYVKYLKC